MIAFASFIIAMFVSMALIPPLMRSAGRMKFMDEPNARKVHVASIPRVGGIAMVIGAVIPILVWVPLDKNISGYLIGAVIIFAGGLWDDRKDLHYGLKFLAQLIAILFAMLYGEILITRIPFFGFEELPLYIAYPLTVFALLGITNAINLADGLDGLAGGTTLLSLGAIAVFAYMADGTSLFVISLAIMGAVLGFLRFNTYPARVFMGDSGSQFIGFSAGVLAIILTQKVNTALSPAVPVMFLGFAIFDTFMVIGQRLYEGRSPFKPDKNHMHHRLLDLGFDHYEAVTLIYLAQSVLVLAAYILRYQSDSLIMGVYFAFCSAIVGFFYWAHETGWKVHSGSKLGEQFFLASKIHWLHDQYRLLHWMFLIAAAIIPIYFAFGVLAADQVALNSGILALVMLVVCLVIYVKFRNKPFIWIERGILYVTGTMVIYLLQTSHEVMHQFQFIHNSFFVILVIVVMGGFRFSKDSRFEVTTLDFLIMFIALALPNLPSSPLGEGNLGIAIAKLIVLFYGFELILSNMWRRWDMMRYVTMGTLAVVGLRGIFQI